LLFGVDFSFPVSYGIFSYLRNKFKMVEKV
jgi:hypothetical protein